MEMVLESDEDAPRRYRAGMLIVFIHLLRHENASSILFAYILPYSHQVCDGVEEASDAHDEALQSGLARTHVHQCPGEPGLYPLRWNRI